MTQASSPKTTEGCRVGLIDLGSNSCRLTVAAVGEDGHASILNRVKTMVRLGEGSFKSGELQPEAMDRTVKALKSFAEICESYGVKEIRAVGTAALRSATNREVFLERARQEAGVDVAVISGVEEASLIRLGVFSGLLRLSRPVCLVDIGGGSTEISVSTRRHVSMMESTDMGCVLLTDAVRGDAQGRMSKKGLREMRDLVLSRIRHATSLATKAKFDRVVASSGTAQALVNLAEMPRFAPLDAVTATADGREAKLSALREVVAKLADMTIEERAALPAVSASRAQVVLAGGVILVTVLEALGVDAVTVTMKNLQDGQLVDYLERNGLGTGACEDTRRIKSVRRLAKRFHCEKAHAKRVRRLVSGLMVSLDAEEIVPVVKEDAELVQFAARLHDIGIDISYKDHHRMGAWLVQNVGLIGFTEGECLKMARYVFWHNNPSASLPVELDSEREVLPFERWAALSLALSEKLDRTHRSLVHSASWKRGKGVTTLVVRADPDATIEKTAIEKMLTKANKRMGLGTLVLDWQSQAKTE